MGLDGLAANEIAVALDITANTAGVRLHRAKQKLKSTLAANARSNPDEKAEGGS
jgi:DNA-directed RNA polymerase specialized sigma24 family protein